MVLTATDNVVTETMSRGCTEACVMVITDVLELKRPWLSENDSNVSQIAVVALTNGQKDLPVCDTCLSHTKILKCGVQLFKYMKGTTVLQFCFPLCQDLKLYKYMAHSPVWRQNTI